MIVTAIMWFHKKGSGGIPELHEFFEATGVSLFVGTSISALQKVSKTMDEHIVEFDREEVETIDKKCTYCVY